MIRYELIEPSTVLESVAGVIAVDVGGRNVPGVIDHHEVGVRHGSTAALIRERPDLVLDHLRAFPRKDLTVVLHRHPDLDCVVAAWLVQALHERGNIPRAARALVGFVNRVEAGELSASELGPESLYARYVATTTPAAKGDTSASSKPVATTEAFLRWLARGLALVEAVSSRNPKSADDVRLPPQLPGWEREEALLAEDPGRFRDDLDRATTVELSLTLPRPQGGVAEARGIRVVEPRALLFQHWAQAAGYRFVHAVFPQAINGADRHVITVAPGGGLWLRGLGQLLEEREVALRHETGTHRGGEPRWGDVENADPWYDGRYPARNYSLVETPFVGTQLTVDAVVEAVLDTKAWTPLGRPVPERVCSDGCRYPESSGHVYCPRHGFLLLETPVGGRYSVVSKLGRGGFGVVFRVEDHPTGEHYALKMLAGHEAVDYPEIEQFLREAIAASRVNHPSVVRIADAHFAAGDHSYIVMELIDGISLEPDFAVWRARKLDYPWERLKEILLQLCDALGVCHAAGIIHRDLKPENIMLEGEKTPGSPSSSPRIKLVDFGLALVADPEISRLTVQGLRGTMAYMAPEQYERHEPDPRIDLYAVGAMMFEALSGKWPYLTELEKAGDGENLMRLHRLKLEGEPPDWAHRHPVLDRHPALEELILDLLARDAEQRPADIEAVRRVIQAS